MKRDIALPRIANIEWLARLAEPFPASIDKLSDLAKHWKFGRNTMDFLRLFPKNEIFESKIEFLTRCEELEMMIREGRNLPAETLRSPDG